MAKEKCISTSCALCIACNCDHSLKHSKTKYKWLFNFQYFQNIDCVQPAAGNKIVSCLLLLENVAGIYLFCSNNQHPRRAARVFCAAL